jgi:hypothetical protein
MTGSKPFHQFLQETLSPYGFLAERHLNASFSNAVGLKALGLGKASRRHHLLGSGVRTPNRLVEPSCPSSLAGGAAPFSQLAHDEAVPFLEA